MKTIKERGYTLESSYAELYWKFPQFLLKNEKYKKMKDSSKIAYMLFKDRIPLAIKNKWIDDDNMLYLVFKQQQLMDLLNCYQGKVKSTLDELQKFGLLEVIRGTFDPKKGENTPNRYYLLQPELESSDVYFTEKNAETLENTGYAEIARRKSEAETLENTGYAEIARRGETLENTGYAEIAQDKDISNTDNKDTKKTDTVKTAQTALFGSSVSQSSKTEIEELREQELLKHFADTYQERSFLSYENLKLIALFSDTLIDAENMQGIILRAKKSMEKEHDEVLVVDKEYLHNQTLDIQGEIAKTLRRVYHKRKTDKKIQNIDNYIFSAFKNLFDTLICEWKAANAETNKNTTITLHNWLE
jgi:hypothetical protein